MGGGGGGKSVNPTNRDIYILIHRTPISNPMCLSKSMSLFRGPILSSLEVYTPVFYTHVAECTFRLKGWFMFTKT